MRELVWGGKIPFVKDGRKFYFDIEDLDEYIEKNKSTFI
jgi:excisionase family DNA binding protein